VVKRFCFWEEWSEFVERRVLWEEQVAAFLNIGGCCTGFGRAVEGLGVSVISRSSNQLKTGLRRFNLPE